ncbi:MAG: HD domain-containing protein [Dysgonamonadaceae bacterium]|jgi:GTP pyrophosphokinase|nr:HD domain-containing protein [Dysgonamonadaceae bacterium]
MERKNFILNCRKLLRCAGNTVSNETMMDAGKYIKSWVQRNGILKDKYGLDIINRCMMTAIIVAEEIGLRGNAVIAVMLSYIEITAEPNSLEHENEIRRRFGDDVAGIILGLNRVKEIYDRNVSIESENFRRLLLSFVDDVRVILIMIADRLYLMRMGKWMPEDTVMRLSQEVSFLYAPLSHRLGLYSIKSELEDLSLKFFDREMYDFIATKINETKQSRDEYIASFISPVEKRLLALNLNFDIKGRIKSIHSIRNKLIKQKIDFEHIYDLFAIRIILDTPKEREKAECWQVYSIITDMYQPNPNRLKDWLSTPKSNGYESLHTTVMGHEGRWVEVQIRSRRMDEIAERGLAAHWKYKGVSGENGLDELMNNIREALEHRNSEPAEIIRDLRMDLYGDEIFVFTPKGDLFKLPRCATVLDFAFAVHSQLGCKCVSAQVNGKNVTIRHRLHSGDQVDVQTSQNQTPKQDWLNFAITSKALVKIRQSLKEHSARQAEYAKESLQRRFKNRRIDQDEATLMRFISKKGYKTVTDFYADIANGRFDVNTTVEQYIEFERSEKGTSAHTDRSAGQFVAPVIPPERSASEEDVLLIDHNLTGIDYSLAKCCSPVYGDEIFGFVSSKGLKIHRRDCPNVPEMFGRFGSKLVNVRWSGKPGANFAVTLKIVGNDDIGIITNITSLISQERGMMLRSINVDSKDGLFQGTLTVMLTDTSAMKGLIRKIRTVKGVKTVNRS